MFTDVELQYFIQLIQKKDCKENSDEVKEENTDYSVNIEANNSPYGYVFQNHALKSTHIKRTLWNRMGQTIDRQFGALSGILNLAGVQVIWF